MSHSALLKPLESKTTTSRNYSLVAGGTFSLLFAAFQVSGIWWSPSAIRYMGGPADLSRQKPIMYALLCLALGAITAVFGVYALSGAGRIRRLPLLRTALTAITAVYLLRGMLFIPEVPVIMKHPELVRFLAFSLISLCVGALYLKGLIRVFRDGHSP